MLKADEKSIIYEKGAEFLYCGKCKEGFVVRKVYFDEGVKAFVYGEEQETIKFCPFCGFGGGKK